MDKMRIKIRLSESITKIVTVDLYEVGVIVEQLSEHGVVYSDKFYRVFNETYRFDDLGMYLDIEML